MLWACIRLPQLMSDAQTCERDALERLAAWAYQYSGQIGFRCGGPSAQPDRPHPHESLLWLEIEASSALFGHPAALLSQLTAALHQLGYRHTGAAAPTPAAAALLARAAPSAPILCATPAALRTCLTPLPLPLLELPPPTIAALQSAGLRRIGQLLELPAAALARRFGPQTCRYLEQIDGRRSEPLPAWQPPQVYRARREFDSDVHETTALLFPLQRLLQEFQGYLRGRDRAVLRFTLELQHRRQAPTVLAIGLSAPAREAAQFLLLARERLGRLALSAPITALTVGADEFTSPAIAQGDFFDGVQPLPAQLGLLLDRLRARLGDTAVQSLACRDDHRPERAWTAAAVPVTAPDAAAFPVQTGAAPRPCWLLETPRPIEPPELLAGPERIESGWWDGADAVRDYYIARGSNGARVWVFRDRIARRWYLHGLWS